MRQNKLENNQKQQSNVFGLVSIISGALSLVFMPLLSGVATMYATIILLPLGLIVLVVAPVALTICIWSFSAFIVQRLLNLQNSTAGIIGLVIVVFSLVLPAHFINYRLNKEVVTLISDDRELAENLPSNRTIGVMRDVRISKQLESQCDEFCQRSLLTGAAKRVIYFTVEENDQLPTKQLTGTAYEIVSRDQCSPIVPLPKRGWNISFPNGLIEKNAPSPAELLRFSHSKGKCLESSRASVMEADYLLSSTHPRRALPPYEAGYDLSFDRIDSHRYTIWKVNSQTDVVFSELYRKTSIRAHEMLGGIFIPTSNINGLRGKAGWAYSVRRENIERFQTGLSWSELLIDVAGFDLLPSLANWDEEKKKQLTEIFIENPVVTQFDSDAIGDFFARLARARGAARSDLLDAETIEIVLSSLNDRRFPVPDGAYHFPNDFGVLSPTYVKRLAAITFARLENFASPKEVSALGSIVRKLPVEIITQYRTNILRLSKSNVVREYAGGITQRLPELGEDGLRELKQMIVFGLSGGENFFRENYYQHPYLSGMIGICRMGKAAESAMPFIMNLLATESLPVHGSYWKMTVNTLISVGIKDSEITRRLTSDSEEKKKQFNRIRASIAAGKLRCEY